VGALEPAVGVTRRGRKGLLQWIWLHRLGVTTDSASPTLVILMTVIGVRLGRGHRGSGQVGALNPGLDAGCAGLFHVDHRPIAQRCRHSERKCPSPVTIAGSASASVNPLARMASICGP